MPAKKERQLPKVGTIFKRKHKGKQYQLKVVKSSKGIAYEFNDRIFNTPTAAAKSLVNSEVNGWAFWNMDN